MARISLQHWHVPNLLSTLNCHRHCALFQDFPLKDDQSDVTSPFEADLRAYIQVWKGGAGWQLCGAGNGRRWE